MTVVSASPAHRPRRALLVLAAVGMVLVVGATAATGLRAEWVQHRYGVWALQPGPHPPVIWYRGRDYRRGGPVTVVPPDAARVDPAPGGSVILSEPSGDVAPTVVYVRCPDGSLLHYDLSGGP
jgi:hypothetical protein